MIHDWVRLAPWLSSIPARQTSLAEHFARVPSPSHPKDFWFDWGPIFYRGRLDGSARVLCVGSDPGPTERIPGRCLVGNAGQRVQGFLAKLGLTRSYVCVNAWAYAVHPPRPRPSSSTSTSRTSSPGATSCYDRITGPELQAVVAFGGMAQRAVELWDSHPDVPIKRVPHPSSRDPDKLLDAWRAAVEDLRGVVTPDPDGDNTGPELRRQVQRGATTPRSPRRDLPFGVPAFLGDDASVRQHGGQSAVSRPCPTTGTR